MVQQMHTLSGSHAGDVSTPTYSIRCQVRMQVAPELFQGSAMNAVKDINIKEGVSTITGCAQ